MVVIAWTRTYSVVLPEIMEMFAMSPRQGGRFIATIELGSVFSLLVLSFAIERIGAVRTLMFGLPAVVIALVAMTSIHNLLLITPFLVLLGSGMAWTTTGINTLMAATGERRSFYLGLMHSTYSMVGVVAPLIAAWVLQWYSWQTWYRGVSFLAICCMMLIWKFEISAITVADKASQRDHKVPITPNVGPSVMVIGTICLGVFTLAGIQGVFNTWSYLYFLNIYATKTELAVWSPAGFWGGVLIGRVGIVWLTRFYSARTLLIISSLIPSVVMGAEHLCSSPWVALLAMLAVGVGVSGTYQLGTQWAAERLPHRVGTASTAVMASAWLGIASWPWAAGALIDATSFACLVSIVGFGSLVAAIAFAATTRI